MTATVALVAAAMSLGSLHTLAPDHWVPFAAIARAERWSTARTAAVTALCGLGHVSVSVALGLCGAWFGLELVERFGRRLEGLAGFLLIAFGIAYGAWGWHRAVSSRWHEHDHGRVHWHGRGGHAHRHATERRMTPWALFALFSADPCVAVVPLMFAAVPLGAGPTIAVVGGYEVATIATMVLLVLPARAAATAVGARWADRYGDALAGAVIAGIGVLVAVLGV